MSRAPSRAGRWDGRTESELGEIWGSPYVEAWSEIGSTNDRAAELLREGSPPWSVVIAEHQTAGRGRRGAAWMSEPGAGIWLSIVLPADEGVSILSLLTGVACAEAIDAMATGVAVGVKWPNDLVIDQRKVGGILVEAFSGGTVAGIGLNTRAPRGGFPAELAVIAGAIETYTQGAVDRVELAAGVIRTLRAAFSAGDRVDATITGLRKRDALLGRSVTTESAGPGIARGVDATGALLLERPDGSTVPVVSGSVRALPPPA